jgi:hypothetical protein
MEDKKMACCGSKKETKATKPAEKDSKKKSK